MSFSMADYAVQSQEEGTMTRNNLRKQLAFAVRSVQWSYAIFWSLSRTQPGVLEWGDGYFNGDIKKRKKGQAMELRAHKFGLQRTRQLRQLYMRMHLGETDHSRTGLSPDDVSDEEWFFLVSMSYVFNPGQCLPGKALANAETIWLCNAQFAESKVFPRSLLARSATIQTVVCFPYLGGVIELGVTELVAEDHNLLQHVKACLLDCSKPNCHGKFSSADTQDEDDDDDDKNKMSLKISHPKHGPMLEDSSNTFQELQEWNLSRLSSTDLGSDDDLHYRRILSTILKQANSRNKNPNLDCPDFDSSFIRWKKGEIVHRQQPQDTQNLLRKILYTIPSMHNVHKENPRLKRSAAKYAFSDKMRENEKFRIRRSRVPSIQEIDQEPILNNTIKYMKELEARVAELESCMGSVDFEGRPRKNNHFESIEEASDNYIIRETKQEKSNRKSDEIIAPDVKVKVKEENVLIEIRCPYREYIVADMMDAITNLQMDAQSVQSSSLDGYLTLCLKAKFRGAATAPAGLIRRELRRVLEINIED